MYSFIHLFINIYNITILISLTAAGKREDGPWAEPAGALELQQSEGVVVTGIN